METWYCIVHEGILHSLWYKEYCYEGLHIEQRIDSQGSRSDKVNGQWVAPTCMNVLNGIYLFNYLFQFCCVCSFCIYFSFTIYVWDYELNIIAFLNHKRITDKYRPMYILYCILFIMVLYKNHYLWRTIWT